MDPLLNFYISMEKVRKVLYYILKVERERVPLMEQWNNGVNDFNYK